MVTWPALPQQRRACGDALVLRGPCQLRVRVFPRPANRASARALPGSQDGRAEFARTAGYPKTQSCFSSEELTPMRP